MPDRRSHRGARPGDDRIFAGDRLDALRTAATEYAWLLDRGYPEESTRALVGDRHRLVARAREALRRSICSAERAERRRRGRCSPGDVTGEDLAIDGYNVLITVEAALSGGLLLVGRDGVLRDLASLSGSYRKVEETIPAIEAIAAALAPLAPRSVRWLLDRPVSNSGRLAALLREHAAGAGAGWSADVVDDPDRALVRGAAIGATSDGPVLERLARWLPLADLAIERAGIPVWRIDLAAGIP